ncbi:MAG: Na+/H+ antiporter subunit E, partial [Rhodospirillales bacterium]
VEGIAHGGGVLLTRAGDDPLTSNGEQALVLHAVSLSAVLAALWWLLSGHTEPLIVGLGVVSVALCVFVAIRMDLVDHEGHPIHFGFRGFTYHPWLLKEIVVANFQVAAIICKRKMPVDPLVFTVRATQPTELGHVVYANSITLTPGTVSIHVADSEVTVHALNQGFADGVLTGDMDARVTKLDLEFDDQLTDGGKD